MTLRDPIVIATIRGLLTALGQGALTGLTAYQVSDNAGDSLVVGAIAFLIALGIRGGVEGVYDQRKGPREDAINDATNREYLRPKAIVGEPRAVRPPGTPGRDFHDMFSRDPAANLAPVPTVDFDQPYHRDTRDGTPHPGNTSAGCQWCLAKKLPLQ